MSKEIKGSWQQLKLARDLLDAGKISMDEFNDKFYKFYGDAEPLIENLEDDDSE